MEFARFIVDHPAAHRDGVAQDFISQPQLGQGVNSAGGKGEVDRSAADGVASAGVGATFLEVDFVPSFAEKGAQ